MDARIPAVLKPQGCQPCGRSRSIASLPKTKRAFPGINRAAYAVNSRTWPDNNIWAWGPEYTSAPWDDWVSVEWGHFVPEAYRDVLASGIF